MVRRGSVIVRSELPSGATETAHFMPQCLGSPEQPPSMQSKSLAQASPARPLRG
jgi:hypothetical protein